MLIPFTAKALATNSSYDSTQLYFFYQEECKDCDKTKKWVEEELKGKNNIRIEYIKIEENKELNKKVKNTLKLKKDNEPLVVIGTNYFVGFNKIKNNLTKAIKSYEDKDDYCDIISKIRNNEDIKKCLNQNKNIYNQSMPIKIVTMICALSAIIVLIIIKKKKPISK